MTNLFRDIECVDYMLSFQKGLSNIEKLIVFHMDNRHYSGIIIHNAVSKLNSHNVSRIVEYLQRKSAKTKYSSRAFEKTLFEFFLRSRRIDLISVLKDMKILDKNHEILYYMLSGKIDNIENGPSVIQALESQWVHAKKIISIMAENGAMSLLEHAQEKHFTKETTWFHLKGIMLIQAAKENNGPMIDDILMSTNIRTLLQIDDVRNGLIENFNIFEVVCRGKIIISASQIIIEAWKKGKYDTIRKFVNDFSNSSLDKEIHKEPKGFDSHYILMTSKDIDLFVYLHRHGFDNFRLEDAKWINPSTFIDFLNILWSIDPLIVKGNVCSIVDQGYRDALLWLESKRVEYEISMTSIVASVRHCCEMTFDMYMSKYKHTMIDVSTFDILDAIFDANCLSLIEIFKKYCRPDVLELIIKKYGSKELIRKNNIIQLLNMMGNANKIVPVDSLAQRSIDTADINLMEWLMDRDAEITNVKFDDYKLYAFCVNATKERRLKCIYYLSNTKRKKQNETVLRACEPFFEELGDEIFKCTLVSKIKTMSVAKINDLLKEKKQSRKRKRELDFGFYIRKYQRN